MAPTVPPGDLLAALRVAVVGLEGHGAHLAALLAACGVGELVLVDPYPCQPPNLALMPLVGEDAVGRPREQALAAALAAQVGPTRVRPSGLGEVTREGIEALAPSCGLLAGCYDEGFSITNHWLNAASLAHGVPVLYARVGGHLALVGPLVVPGRTACYACWRLRSLACAEDRSVALAHERFLDERCRPALHDQGVPPSLLPVVATAMAREVLERLLRRDAPPLALVREVDARRPGTRTHAVLAVPACPACGTAARERPPPPVLERLTGPSRPAVDLLEVAPILVSPRTGVVQTVEQVAKHPDEPVVPHVIGVRLANHRGVDGRDPGYRDCSGKGMTLAEAQRSALGEAVERYASTQAAGTAVRRARRSELDEASLDPRSLVLYRPEQYATLPYAPYRDATVMGWVTARSLVGGAPVLVPAVAVFMGYPVDAPAELICPTTSSGLAAGTSLAAAVLAAALEVVERDAFVVTWENRIPGQLVDPSSHPDHDLVALCGAYARRGVEIQLHRLAGDQPVHVFLAIAVQREGPGPAAAAGLGADLDAARAARSAVLEACQLRPGLQACMRTPGIRTRVEQLVADPHLVTTPDDHALLYADARSLGAFGFLEAGRQVALDWTAAGPSGTAARLRTLVEHLRSQRGDLLYCDLTPPDLAPLGLYAARVLVPEFQPLAFGWNERRLGGTRLYELPRLLGATSGATEVGQLNPDPHPLA